jgi:hypothetical protein
MPAVEMECQVQGDINIAYNQWLTSVDATGGCGTYDFQYPGPPAPDACGGTNTITFTVTDQDCFLTSSCVSTFTVTAAPDITITGVDDFTTTECQTQGEVDIVFAAWLGGFGWNGRLS